MMEPIYEFQVIPAPRKGERVEGLRTDDARMANTLTGLLNDMALDGWDYVRADTLPNDMSSDLSGTAPPTMTLLVFRRLLVVLGGDIDSHPALTSRGGA